MYEDHEPPEPNFDWEDYDAALLEWEDREYQRYAEWEAEMLTGLGDFDGGDDFHNPENDAPK